jgi:hypothetical protein
MSNTVDLIDKFNKIYEKATLKRIDDLFKQNKDTIKPYAQVGKHVYEIFKTSCRKNNLIQVHKPRSFSHYIDEVSSDFKLDMKNCTPKAEINIILDTLIELHEEGVYVDYLIEEYKKAQNMAISHIETKNNNPSNEDMIMLGESVWVIEQLNKFKYSNNGENEESLSFRNCIKKIGEYGRDRYYLVMALARSLE